MSGCYLDDDGSLSADFTVVEGISEEVEVTPQSLWIGVRPIWYGTEPGEVMIQVCYQEAHLAGPLLGPVWVTPAVWRELNAAVEWRLRERERMHRGGKSRRRCYDCGKKLRFRTVCVSCKRKDRKFDRKRRKFIRRQPR